MRFLCVFTIVLSCFQGIAQREACPIIPTPAAYQQETGVSYIKDRLLVNPEGANEQLLNYFSNKLKTVFGIEVKMDSSKFALSFQKHNESNENDYEITFLPENKSISFQSDASLLYAMTSFFQLIQEGQQGWEIRHCRIKDGPAFEWRGLHLDVSRHFFTVDEVKRFIDLMALYKFNKFHWHLTDDQGWRIEIKRYPRLCEVGAYRDSTVIGHYTDSPRKYEHERYGGFYTQEQIKDVVAYAKDRCIDVVPEIELPGHSRAALAAYSQLSCTGEQQPVPGLWGIFDDIYCSKSESIDFMKDVLDEVVELFPSDYIHIGGDEAPKKRWKECEDCQRVIRKNKLKDEHELQSYFIGEIDKFLTKKGKKLIGWDEILEGGLSPNAAVMSWRGVKGGIEAAKQQHYVVMTPTTYCYFDYYQSGHKIEPLAIGGFLPLEKVYRFNPVPKELTADEAKYVLGGQANLWTEYIPSMEQLEYMTYPRALALAQSVWCVEKPEYKDFLKTYIYVQETYLKRNKVNFARSIHYPELILKRQKNGINARFHGVEDDSRFDVMMTTQVTNFGGGGGFVLGNNDSLFMERNLSGIEKIVKYGVRSDKYEGSVDYRFKLHGNLGVPIEMKTQPHPKYNHNGSLTLVDGIRGKRPWKGDEWLGFQEKEITFILDLEKEDNLKSLEIGFLKANGSWIYLPESVSVRVSGNGATWKKVELHPSNSQFIEDEDFKATLKAKARYVEITIHPMEVIPEGMGGEGHVPWTFIDEVQLTRGK